jgi:hypothetical protein
MNKMLPLMLLVLSLSLSGAQLAKVTLPDEVEVEGNKLVLNGMALREKVIFKVYVDGLYLPARETRSEVILQNDQPRHNVMHFLRSVGREKLNDAWMDGLKANTPQADPALKAQFDQLAAWMEDMEATQVMAFTYLPGIGTRVTVKGQLKGTLEGKAFADALFACWIGPKPGPGQKFKKGLLGL